MSIGLGKSELAGSSSSSSVPGKVSGGSVSAPSATVNLSAIPGIIDWFVFATTGTSGVPSGIWDLSTSFHWRKGAGERLLSTFRWFWQTAWFTASGTPFTPPTAFSAAIADDGSIDAGDGSGGSPTSPMTADAKCLSLRASNSVNFPDGWGFSLRVPANQIPKTIDLYLGVMNVSMDVIAHITDGSSPDTTVTISDSSGPGGALAFKQVSFVFNAANGGEELVITMIARNTQSPSVEASRLSFQAAVLHF